MIPRLKFNPDYGEDDVIDEDIVLLWGKEKIVITGSDILGWLLEVLCVTGAFVKFILRSSLETG